jgi:serine/threonine protein kinase
VAVVDSRHPIARIEPPQAVLIPAEPSLLVEPDRRLDLRPFDKVLPTLVADVAAIYGPKCRLAPVAVWERLYSHVLRAGVWHAGDEAPREHLFIKVSKYKVVDGAPDGMRKRVERDFAVTQRVFDRMAGGESYGAVRPIACYPAHLAIVTEEMPGETLLKVVEQRMRWVFDAARCRDLQDVFASAGRWIRDFQEPADGAFSLEWIRDYIDNRLQRIAKVSGRRGERLRERVLQHIDHLSSQLPTEPAAAVTVHADLSPSNIMACGSRVVVLDFAMARPGHPLQDVARLFTQLDLLTLKPQYRQSVVRPLQQALLRGFDAALGMDDPAFRLQVLAQRINHLGSLSTKKYGIVERTYNRFIVRQHWRWIQRETQGGERESWAAWG